MMIAKIFEVYEGKIVKWGTYSFKQYCLEQKNIVKRIQKMQHIVIGEKGN